VINLLAGTKIAKVSKTPGKTQTLNLFLIQDRWVFGDFPGYGFAKVPEAQKRQFELLVKEFLNPVNFQFAIQIVDARHPGMDSDILLMEWLKASRLPHLIVLNKSDKLNRKERTASEKQACKSFPDEAVLFASTLSGEGKREIEKILNQLMPGVRIKDPGTE